MLAAEPNATWGVDFARADGTGGFLRLLRVGARCWCWVYLVGPEIGLVVVRDHDVAPPRREEVLDVRAEGLWMELICETPDEHWTYGVEAFGVRLDSARDALEGEIGERLPVGCDLEWETDGSESASTGSVHGDLLVGDDRIELDAHGVLRDSAPPDSGWPVDWQGACRFADGSWVRPAVVATAPSEAGVDVAASWRAGDDGPSVGVGGPHPVETLALVPVPLVERPRKSAPVLVRVLARLHGGHGGSGTGWLEVLQSTMT